MTKYHARRIIIDDFTFSSEKEGRRYQQLKLLIKAGRIKDLKLQPRFPLIVNGHKVCTYIGDFQYIEDGRTVIEDSKGFRTREYLTKRKLLLALNPGMDHREV